MFRNKSKPRYAFSPGYLFLFIMLSFLPAPLAGQGGPCGFCVRAWCGEGEHAIWQGMDILAGAHNDCWAPGDCRLHSACSPEKEDQDLEAQIIQAALDQNAEGLRSLLSSPPQSIYVNLERNVLQVLSCDRQFVVSQYGVGRLRLSELVDPR